MRRFIHAMCYSTVLFVFAVAASGEQRVVLRSGSILSGKARVEGENLVVTVDEAELTVPLKDVATVAPAVNSSETAQRLLLRSLEYQLLNGDGNNQIGLLEEAYRLAPEDPQVAYWYARSLADSGNAIAAQKVYQARKEEIVASYPDWADQLGEKIESRLKLKSLPAALIKRIDEIEKLVGRGNGNPRGPATYAAYLRVVDQENTPLEENAFRIDCPGQQQKLEWFPDGHILLVYSSHNFSQTLPCKLIVDQMGWEAATFEFRGGADEVANCGEFRVRRLSDSDQIPAVITVRDAAGKPLDNVTIALTTRSQFRQQGVPPIVTDGRGKAEIKLLPGDYFCQVIREDYQPLNERLFVNADQKGPFEFNFQLNRAISAAAIVVWRATAPADGAGAGEMTLNGEYELRISPQGNIGYRGGRGGIEGIRLIQTGDLLKIQFTEQRVGPQFGENTAWIGRMKNTEGQDATEDGTAEDRLKVFSSIDLEKLVAIKDSLQLPRPNLVELSRIGRPLQLPAEQGATFVGTIHGRDGQSGRPVRFDFKVMVTELSNP